MRYWLPVVAFFVLLLLLMFGLNSDRDKNALPSPFIGKQAPDFELPYVLDPQQVLTPASYAGKAVLINVWATWCVGCRQEHDFLLALAESNTIPIYGINWRDNREEAVRWLERLGNPYIASGFDGSGRVGINWGVYGAPETFLIGRDGTVLHKHLGPLSPATWERDFVPLLRGGG
jgi:cytochrome c biogenesis protein CcmG/thiol:disulfide interchange protein DsbE